jgi:hypothetical protein
MSECPSSTEKLVEPYLERRSRADVSAPSCVGGTVS